jgi:dTDP-4-dehydrorhamnose reductase
MSWRELAQAAARRAGLGLTHIVTKDDRPPLCFALTSERGIIMPPLEGAIDRYFNEMRAHWDSEDILLAAE